MQSVTCLAADTCPTARVTSSNPAQSHNFVEIDSHNFVEIDYEIITTVIILPSSYSRRFCCQLQAKYVHKVLVNRLVKLAQEKSVDR